VILTRNHGQKHSVSHFRNLVGLMDEIFSWTFIGQAESLEAELAREERIDAKIDKDIVALERMKTMQAMGLGRRSNVYAQEYESTKHLDSPEGSPDKVDNYQ